MLYQTEKAKRRVAPTPFTAGALITARYDWTFSAGFVAASDKLELGILPLGCRIVGYKLIPSNMNGNISVGIMSGEVGLNDAARTVGAELYSAVAIASTIITAELAAALDLAPVQADRSIGVTLSADVAGAANKKIGLILNYVMD